jgi:hypothetical protein
MVGTISKLDLAKIWSVAVVAVVADIGGEVMNDYPMNTYKHSNLFQAKLL